MGPLPTHNSSQSLRAGFRLRVLAFLELVSPAVTVQHSPDGVGVQIGGAKQARMTFRCCLLAAMIAVFAAGTGMVGSGGQTAHAAAASTTAGTTPSGVQVSSDVKHDTSPPLRTLKGVRQVA